MTEIQNSVTAKSTGSWNLVKILIWLSIFLQTVPEGDWFCPNCRPKEVRPSPRKGRQTYIAESDDSESESEEEEEDEDEEEERSDEEEEEEESGEESR